MSVAGILAIFLHEQSFGALAAAIAIALIALAGIYQFSTQFILHEDRIVRRTIFGELSIGRDEIEAIEIRTVRDAYRTAYLIPKHRDGDEMAIPSNFVEFDSTFHAWIAAVIGNDVDLLEAYRKTYKPGWAGFRRPD